MGVWPKLKTSGADIVEYWVVLQRTLISLQLRPKDGGGNEQVQVDDAEQRWLNISGSDDVIASCKSNKLLFAASLCNHGRVRTSCARSQKNRTLVAKADLYVMQLILGIYIVLNNTVHHFLKVFTIASSETLHFRTDLT